MPFADPAVSGHDTVATTARSVSWCASCIAIEPTPPAPPTIRIAFARAGNVSRDVKPVEHRLPRGDDEMIFGVRALPPDAAGVETRRASSPRRGRRRGSG